MGAAGAGLLAPKARRCGGPSPGAAATQFGREGYRSTPVTGLARDAQAGTAVACARFPGRETAFRTSALTPA